MFDNNLFFRTTGTSLTATEPSAAITINETPLDGLCLVVGIPKSALNTGLQVTLQHSTDNTTWTNLCVLDTFPVGANQALSTVPKTLRQRFMTRSKFVRTVATTSGAGTPDFGGVYIAIGDEDNANNYAVTAGTTPQGV